MFNSETTTHQCIEDGPGYINKDGYVRVWDKPKRFGGRLVMRHRLHWENRFGKINSGMEIDHLCKNRKCYNTDHLRLITRSEHASHTNSYRYNDIISVGVAMLIDGKTKEEVCKATGRTLGAINKWIREGRLNNGKFEC